MKILNTIQEDNKLIVTVENFPHAQPVFPNNLTEQELQEAVDVWATNQAEIDSINNGTASPEIIEKHKPKPIFNADIAIAREAQVFPVDRIIVLAPFTYTINEMIRYENWTQLKQVISGLIQGGVATAEDYEMFNGILKEQGVDLDLIV
jgi:hypothetical protein